MRVEKNKGFTLLELLIVIAIIALVMAIVIPSVSGLLNVSEGKIAKANEIMLKNALEMYFTVNEKYPVGDVDNLEDALVPTYLNQESWDKMINKFTISYSSSDGSSFSLTVTPKN